MTGGAQRAMLEAGNNFPSTFFRLLRRLLLLTGMGQYAAAAAAAIPARLLPGQSPKILDTAGGLCLLNLKVAHVPPRETEDVKQRSATPPCPKSLPILTRPRGKP